MSIAPVREEFFLVDIWFPNGVITRNVELPQSSLDWYAENFPRVSIVQAGTPVPEDIQPVDDPIDIIDEPITDPPDLFQGAIRVEFQSLSYTGSDTPNFSMVNASVILTKTGTEDLGIFQIVMKVSGVRSGITVGEPVTKSTNVFGRHSFSMTFISTADRDIKAEIFILSPLGTLSLPEDKTARFSGLTGIPADRLRPAQISPLMPIIGAGAAIAFLSGEFPKKKKRRR